MPLKQIPAAKEGSAVDGRTRVLVLYASQRLTGPGRGLLQLLEAARPSVAFTLCSFARPGVTSDFHRAALERRICAEVIPQAFAWDPRMLNHCLEIARKGGFSLVQSHGYKTDRKSTL